MCVCVCKRERERDTVCVCVCVRERERERRFFNFILKSNENLSKIKIEIFQPHFLSMAQHVFIFLFTLDVATYKVNNFFVPHKSSNQNKK